MGVTFCSACGDLLEPNTGAKASLECTVCGTENKGLHQLEKSYSALHERWQYFRHLSKSNRDTFKADGVPFNASNEATLRRAGSIWVGYADGCHDSADVSKVWTMIGRMTLTCDIRCEQCGCLEVRYYTQQLRSADEGSTVFYVSGSRRRQLISSAQRAL